MVLSVATTLPWIAGIVLTDIFAGLAVLALYLIVLRADALKSWERAALFALLAFSAATHSATFVVLLGLLLAGLVLALVVRRGLVPFAGLGRAFAALALGAVMLLAANYAVAGRLAWTPGGAALTFGRMLQDGIVARYLAEHCPDPRFRLCDHRDELPTDADVFFWGESVFDRLGRFEGMADEMSAIAYECLRTYPLWQIRSALSASLRQLVKVATGEGVVKYVGHTYWTIERFLPSALPAMQAARQPNDELGFVAINRLHVPVALAAMALVAAFVLIELALRLAGSLPRTREAGADEPSWRAKLADLLPLAATVALTILGNAVVCGVFANPHDRYGARMAWLATFVVVIAAWRVCLAGISAKAPSDPEPGALDAPRP